MTTKRLTELATELRRLERLCARNQLKSTSDWWRLFNARRRYDEALAVWVRRFAEPALAEVA